MSYTHPGEECHMIFHHKSIYHLKLVAKQTKLKFTEKTWEKARKYIVNLNATTKNDGQVIFLKWIDNISYIVIF